MNEHALVVQADPFRASIQISGLVGVSGVKEDLGLLVQGNEGFLSGSPICQKAGIAKKLVP